MAALTIRLSNSVHQKIKELAARDEISVNQFIASAAAEKMASVMTLDYLRTEAASAQRGDFDRYLGRVADVAADPSDALLDVAVVPSKRLKKPAT
jgi:predicted DNA-binding ribbon-helix-helix protein